MEGDSREIFILRQKLSDRDETICQLKKENEANEDTIKMLKKRLQHLDNQPLSAEIVKKEQRDVKPPLFFSSIEAGTHSSMHYSAAQQKSRFFSKLACRLVFNCR